MAEEPQGSRLSSLAICSICAYSWSFLVFGLQVNLLGPTASVLASRVGVTEPDLGVIFTINGLASIIGAVPSGWLIDNLPGHAVYAAAMAFEALGFALIPFANSFPALAAAFGAVALSWNIVNTAGNTFILYIGNASDNEQLQPFLINMVNALFGAGSLAAPLLAELSATWLANPMSAYWITGALTALSAVTFLLLPSPQSPASSSSNSSSSNTNTCAAAPVAGSAANADADAGAADSLLIVSPAADSVAADSAAAAAAGEDDALSEKSAAASGAWWSILQMSPLLAVIAVFNFLNVGTEVAFGGWIFTYAVKQAGLSPHEGHFLNASYWGAFTVGRVFASFAAVLLKPATLLLASLPLAILGAAAALLAPAAWMGGWLLLAVSMLVGVGVSPGFANALAILDGFEPVSGRVNGLLGGVAGAGCMTVPLVIAQLAKHTGLGYQGLMVVCLVSFVVQLALVPVALGTGRWLQGSRERDEWQSITKDVLPDDQQPLLDSEC